MQNFDLNEALKAIQSGKPITGSDGVLAPLIKQLTEAALSAEIDSYLEQNPTGNRRNGYSKKTVKSAVGSFELETPRDRNGEYEPVLVKKHQTKLTPEIDNRILSLFSHGMSYGAIKDHIAEIYQLEVSEATIAVSLTSLSHSLKHGNPVLWTASIRLSGSMPSTTRLKTKGAMSTKRFTRC